MKFNLPDFNKLHAASEFAVGSIETWRSARSPYYKVYPGIVKSLTSLSLDTELSKLKLEKMCLLIRFAEGKEVSVCGGVVKLNSILVVSTGSDVLLSEVVEVGGKHLMPSTLFVSAFSETIEVVASDTAKHTTRQMIEKVPQGEMEKDLQVEADKFIIEEQARLSVMSTKIALTVILLANDPSVIEPDVLGKDRLRYESETDEEWKVRAVERARRRGTVGWTVGRKYESCPHIRRPHFGLRYTGKGGTVPRIVPIKGSIVHRKKVTDVPTGYILPDGTEDELK